MSATPFRSSRRFPFSGKTVGFTPHRSRGCCDEGHPLPRHMPSTCPPCGPSAPQHPSAPFLSRSVHCLMRSDGHHEPASCRAGELPVRYRAGCVRRRGIANRLTPRGRARSGPGAVGGGWHGSATAGAPPGWPRRSAPAGSPLCGLRPRRPRRARAGPRQGRRSATRAAWRG
jgi:hypothetical protein